MNKLSTVKTEIDGPFRAGRCDEDGYQEVKIVGDSASLPAGTAIIGKVGIDQTTPGTTNAVSIVGRSSITLLNAVISTVVSDWFPLGVDNASVQATVVGTGAVTASVDIEYSNDKISALAGFTISLSGTTSASDGDFAQPKWTWVRCNLTAVTGAGAAVTVTVGA